MSGVMKLSLSVCGVIIWFAGFSQMKQGLVKEFVPDSTIKSIIKLAGSEAEGELWSGVVPQNEGVFKVATFSNSCGTQYLKMRQFPGSFKNSFGLFEVGKLDLKSKQDLKKLPFESFVTESGIRLGISKEELIQIKGKKFQLVNRNEAETLIYTLDDHTSVFLNKYNMPSYTAKYSFLNEKLVAFSFGFDSE
jgi:hypothetical protein